MSIDTLATWHRLVQTRDAKGLDALLADGVVFHSPVVHTPQVGKPVTTQYLAAAFRVFFNETFRYVREVVGPHDAVLEFEVEIDGIVVNGVDMIAWDDSGRIVSFKVMIRPLKAINLIHQKMGEMLKASASAAPKSEATRSALLVIDVQRGISEGEWACADMDRIIGNINSLSTRARAAGMPVVFVQHEENEGPLQHGTPGWQLATGLITEPADVRVRKETPDSFHRTKLQALLKERGVAKLVVCGLQSDFCVDTTVRRALALGYPVTLAADAHSTVDNGVLTAAQIAAHHNATLGSIGSFGTRVTVAQTADIDVNA